MTKRTSIYQKIVVWSFAAIALSIAAIAIILLDSYHSYMSGDLACEYSDRKLCPLETYTQSRILSELSRDGSVALAEIYGREWDSACLVRPYASSHDSNLLSRCTPNFQCLDKLKTAIDQEQRWIGNDHLWGFLLFSGCEFVVSARYEVSRLDVQGPISVDAGERTQIRLVEPHRFSTPDEPAYVVNVVLGSDRP